MMNSNPTGLKDRKQRFYQLKGNRKTETGESQVVFIVTKCLIVQEGTGGTVLAKILIKNKKAFHVTWNRNKYPCQHTCSFKFDL